MHAKGEIMVSRGSRRSGRGMHAGTASVGPRPLALSLPLGPPLAGVRAGAGAGGGPKGCVVERRRRQSDPRQRRGARRPKDDGRVGGQRGGAVGVLLGRLPAEAHHALLNEACLENLRAGRRTQQPQVQRSLQRWRGSTAAGRGDGQHAGTGTGAHLLRERRGRGAAAHEKVKPASMPRLSPMQPP